MDTNQPHHPVTVTEDASGIVVDPGFAPEDAAPPIALHLEGVAYDGIAYGTLRIGDSTRPVQIKPEMSSDWDLTPHKGGYGSYPTMAESAEDWRVMKGLLELGSDPFAANTVPELPTTYLIDFRDPEEKS